MSPQAAEYAKRRNTRRRRPPRRRLRSRRHRRRVLRLPQGARRQAAEQSSSPSAIENELLIIPGGIFSGRDTHFRISYAASEATLERGLEVPRKTNCYRRLGFQPDRSAQRPRQPLAAPPSGKRTPNLRPTLPPIG